MTTLGRSSAGKPALARMSVFHWCVMQSKYPKLAAFWTEVTGWSRSSIMLTTKSITVPHLKTTMVSTGTTVTTPALPVKLTEKITFVFQQPEDGGTAVARAEPEISLV